MPKNTRIFERKDLPQNGNLPQRLGLLWKKKIRQEQWAPQQIVGYCKKHNINMVIVERIYQYIREDKEKGGNLYQYLRHKLKHRKQLPLLGSISIYTFFVFLRKMEKRLKDRHKTLVTHISQPNTNGMPS